MRCPKCKSQIASDQDGYYFSCETCSYSFSYDGTFCPECGCDNPVPDLETTNQGTVGSTYETRPRHCEMCQAKWFDVLRVVSYKKLRFEVNKDS